MNLAKVPRVRCFCQREPSWTIQNRKNSINIITNGISIICCHIAEDSLCVWSLPRQVDPINTTVNVHSHTDWSRFLACNTSSAVIQLVLRISTDSELVDIEVFFGSSFLGISTTLDFFCLDSLWLLTSIEQLYSSVVAQWYINWFQRALKWNCLSKSSLNSSNVIASIGPLSSRI
jgi:hypothetical protein